jgi:hypothetical protein
MMNELEKSDPSRGEDTKWNLKHAKRRRSRNRLRRQRRHGLDLSTYGHSVWRATIEQRSEVLEVPPKVAEILLGVLGDGGGIVRLGKRIIKIPSRSLFRDHMVALAINASAGLMSEESAVNSRAIQRTALQQIASIALREVSKLA